MPKRRKVRLDPRYNFASQRLYQEIVLDAERQNKADIWLWPTEFELMWRLCGKPLTDPTDESGESFVYQSSKDVPARRYIKKPQTEEPSGVLDRTRVDEDDDEC